MIIWGSATRARLIQTDAPTGTATETETETATETETITTVGEEDAVKQMKERRFLHVSAAKPTASDSDPCFPHNKTPHRSGVTYQLLINAYQYLFFLPMLFLYLFLRWLKMVSLRGLADFISLLISLTIPSTAITTSHNLAEIPVSVKFNQQPVLQKILHRSFPLPF